MTRRRGKALRAGLWVMAVVAGLAVVRPWTVRPLHVDKPAAFDAMAFASTVWRKLENEANLTAIDISKIAMSSSTPARARFVAGVGKVTAIDQQSRVGVMRVQILDGGPPVAIQIGPVVRGTALRDATSFIQFSNFANQVEYAAAANALNDHALRTVVAPLPIVTLPGRVVSFIGAVGNTPPRADGTVEVVLVRFGIGDGAAN